MRRLLDHNDREPLVGEHRGLRRVFSQGIVVAVLNPKICTDSVYALVTGTAGRWLQHRAGFLRGQRYVSGGVYVTLGVATAISGSGKD